MTQVRSFNGSKEDITLISTVWKDIFPTWPIAQDRLTRILEFQSGNHVLHPHGFCLTFMSDENQGKIACIGVSREYRRGGLGTSLVKAAYRMMESKVPVETKLQYEISNSFPRFWSGVPKEFMSDARGFFEMLDFEVPKLPFAYFNEDTVPPQDYYRSISNDVAATEVLERVSKLPLTFSPWSPDLYEECIAKQRAEFKGWCQFYELIHQHNLHHEVMVAFNASGQQVGWTAMISPSTLFCVDKSARGQSVGLSLMINAMRNMKERGMEGVFVDSVVIRGFYEALGFEVMWEYEKFVQKA